MLNDKIAELETAIQNKDHELNELKQAIEGKDQELVKLGSENQNLQEELAKKAEEIDDLINHPNEGNSEELYFCFSKSYLKMNNALVKSSKANLTIISRPRWLKSQTWKQLLKRKKLIITNQLGLTSIFMI